MSATRNPQLNTTILVGPTGRTLYLFERDTKDHSACYGSCISLWPPLTISGKPQAGSGVSASLLGTIFRSDGKTQVTYNGHALYYFVSDINPGQVSGQGVNQFGALWYVLSPQGNAITTSGGSSAGGGSS